ncbi:kinase-like protein [Parachaetomium inaequale]|uniref:non-specific serine/threonine protein kinase n=1 Tax=Parachaetomium inaequale TaxID=2588326 RepID=A0AAN6STN6_9PEZI|nr:kinase-like protein [Parachaetomium inaequale]
MSTLQQEVPAVAPLAVLDAAPAPPPADEPRFCPIEDGTESIYSYRPGGLHPVEIGDVFADRYSIVDKLGQGGWSTVWIARDQQLGKYVALKIALAGNCPAGAVDDPRILDHFVIHGPNGDHNAIVTALALMSLHDAKEASYKYIHIGNILLRLLDTLDALSVEEFYKRHKKPVGEEVNYEDGRPLPEGVPAHCYYPTWPGRRSEDVSVSEARILLTDFGVSFSPSRERWELRSRWYDENRVWQHKYTPKSWDARFETRVRASREKAGMETLGADERDAFLGLLKSMLKYHPEERISAVDVLNSEWVQRWAIPELDNVGH